MAFNRINALYRFLFLLIFSVALIIVDHRSQFFAPVRTLGSVINLPFQWLIELPTTTGEFVSTHYPDDSLHRKYMALLEKQLALEVQLQRYDALQAENRRLAKLLSMTHVPDNKQGLLAGIVGIEPDRFTHRVVLNRGIEAGVYVGQPAITPDGVLGQVSAVGVNRSVVTLLTDSSHAIPVLIQRNGLHTIVRGRGESNWVDIPFLSGRADIRNHDILVTSGLGGGFPPGYKVAQVREVVTDVNDTFLRVTAATFVDIDHTKEVLLLWYKQSNPAAATSTPTPAGVNHE